MPGEMPGDEAHAPEDRRLHRVATAMLGLETLAVAGLAIFLVVEIITRTPSDTGSAVALTVLTCLIAVGLAVCTYGARLGRRWARAPGVTWQLLQLLGVALPMAASERWYLGWPLVAFTVVLMGLLVSGVTVTEEGGLTGGRAV